MLIFLTPLFRRSSGSGVQPAHSASASKRLVRSTNKTKGFRLPSEEKMTSFEKGDDTIRKMKAEPFHVATASLVSVGLNSRVVIRKGKTSLCHGAAPRPGFPKISLTSQIHRRPSNPAYYGPPTISQGLRQREVSHTSAKSPPDFENEARMMSWSSSSSAAPVVFCGVPQDPAGCALPATGTSAPPSGLTFRSTPRCNTSQPLAPQIATTY